MSHRTPVSSVPPSTPEHATGPGAPARHPERQPVAGEGVAATLQALGEPRAWLGGDEVLPRRRKELVLLAYLASSRRPVAREKLATLLWGDRPDEKARHSLRQALHRLGTALPGVLEAGPDHVSIAAGRLAYDAARFEADAAEQRWEDAVARWEGELLEGCDDAGGPELQAWLTAERARLGRLHAAALQRLAEQARSHGRWADAAGWAARWAESSPRDAAAALAWVEALRLSGRGDEAAARHAEISARWRELEIDPPAEWRAAGDALARGRGASTPSASAGSAALFGPDLVGRSTGFASLMAAWERTRSGGAAAVSVEGDRGLGKTRLCGDFVARVRAEAGAWTGAARAADAREAGAWAVMRDLLAGLERAPGIGGAPDWALAEAARLVPALRERFRDLPAAEGGDDVLEEAVCRILGDVAEESSILLHVDDASDADPSSTRLLAAVARRRIGGVMLLLTAHPGTLELPNAERIALEPLSPADTEALTASMLELPPDDRGRLSAWVHREAAGNPFYSVELVRALADDGRLASTAGGTWRLGDLPAADPATARPIAAAGVFVARERELETLSAALGRAMAGGGGVRWIAGEPGIGKSALLREFVRRAGERHPHLRVGWGECDALAGEGSAHLPFREIARSLRDVLPRAAAGFDAPRAEGLAEWFTAQVRRAARGAPLLLVIDDLQWADAPSLGLLFHLSRRIADAAVLLVAAYRDAEVAAGGTEDGSRSTATLVAEWKRLYGASGLPLEGLAAPDALRLAAEILEAEPGALAPSLRDRLLRHTGGHPLFVVEAVRELRDRGGIVRGDDGVRRAASSAAWQALPARVEGVIAERVRRLAPDLRRLLAIAAVEGQVFTAEVVAEVAQMEPREVVRRLGELDREHRLLALHGVRQLPGGRASRYRFRHALFQAHVYGLLDAAERRYLHGDVGRALERIYGHRWAEASPQLARHFTEAEDDERAARHLHAAGTRAALASAHDEAAALFARALDAAERSGQGELGDAIREAAADSLHLAGRHAEARAVYGRLLSHASLAGTRARLLRKQGDAWQAEGALEPALTAYGQARAALFEAPEWQGGDFAEWARLEVGWAQALLASGKLGDLLAHVRDAAEGVERYGTPGQRTAVLAALLRELSRREQFLGLDALVSAFRTHAAQALSAGKRREQAGAEFAVGFTQLWRGRLDEAVAPLEAALALAEAEGERWREVVCCTHLALLHRRRGDAEQVRRWTARAAAIGEHVATCDGMAHANQAWLARRSGDAASARREAAAGLRIWAGLSPVYPFQWAARWPLLAAALADGAIDEAVEHARAQLDPEQQPLPDEIARELALAVDRWEGGDLQQTREHLQRAAELAAPLGFL